MSDAVLGEHILVRVVKHEEHYSGHLVGWHYENPIVMIAGVVSLQSADNVQIQEQ